MLMPRSLNSYFSTLPKLLRRRYGIKAGYSRQQLRATIYQCDFNPKYLPLAYILHLPTDELLSVMAEEFPDLDIAHFQQSIIPFLSKKQKSQLIGETENPLDVIEQAMPN